MADYDVFISYRRSDAAGHARALHRDLCRRLDVDRVFFDREVLESGQVFPQRLRDAASNSKVLLALIAPGWLEAEDAQGRRRLDDSDDFVCAEIAVALQHGRKVIPVLFDDTPPPPAGRLPAAIAPLASCDALTLRGKTYEYDVQLEELVRILAATPGVAAPRPPGESIAIRTPTGFEIYGGVSYQPIRLRAPLRDAFKPLLEDRTRVFGGRGTAFAAIMRFVAQPEGGSLVITAPAGFGKTALIANLVEETPEAFAYHFFAPLYGQETLDETFFLQNVVQQMAQWHAYSADLPDQINELRALYQRFIDQPLDKTRVLVLDGLDEVTGWKLQPYLSRTLPPNLHVVATLRDVGQDWPAEYGFPSDQLTHLPLGGLSKPEVVDVLRSVGERGAAVADAPDRLDAVIDVAAYRADTSLGADPFYVRFLAEDIAAGHITPQTIAAQPRGLDAYLDRWWQGVRQSAGDKPVRDLFGTLAAALGPMRRADLEAVSPSLVDEWAGDYFEEVLHKVRRLIRLEPEAGYAIAHPRLRQHMADPARIGSINTYRDRLLQYCSGWATHRSPYAMTYRVAHLVEAGKLEESAQVFTPEWIAAQWSTFGSFARLMGDFDVVARAFLAQEKPEFATIAALAVARQTARELMLDVPEGLLVAWVRLGEVPRVLASINALGRTKGRAAEPMTAVAAELLAGGGTAEPSAAAGSRAGVAADLLDRTIGLLPLVGSSSGQLDALRAVMKVLGSGRELDDSARRTPAQAAIAWARSLSDDDVMRAAALGVVASGLADRNADRSIVETLVGEVRQVLSGITFPADRVMAISCVASACERVSPGSGAAQIRELLTLGDGIFAHSRLRKNPLIHAIAAVTPEAFADPAAAVDLLESLAQRYLARPGREYLGVAVGTVMEGLCRFDRHDAAAALVEQVWQVDDLEAVKAALRVVPSLQERLPKRVRQWLDYGRGLIADPRHRFRVNQQLFTQGLAAGYAAAALWDDAIDLLDLVDGSERADGLERCIELGVSALKHDPAELFRLLPRLVTLADALEVPEQARVQAVIARELATLHPFAAREHAAAAARLCLIELPAGDTDVLTQLAVLAYTMDGETGKAIASTATMKWSSTAIGTLAILIRQPATDQPHDALEPYVAALVEQLRARDCRGDTLMTAAEVVRDLGPVDPAIVQPLIDEIANRASELDVSSAISCFATLAASISETDADAGGRRFATLAVALAPNISAGVGIEAAAIANFYRSLARAARTLDSRLPTISSLLDPVAETFTGVDDRLQIECAKAQVVAARDGDLMREALGRCIGTVRSLAGERPGAFYLARMYADFTGRLAGPNDAQVRAARVVARAITRCAEQCPDQGVAAMEELLSVILTIESHDDRVQAFVDFCDECGTGPAAFAASAPAWFEPGLDDARSAGLPRFARAATAAVAALCGLGALDDAQQAADTIADEELRTDLQASVSRARDRQAMGTLSVFDRAFMGLDNGDLAWSVLHTIAVEQSSDEWLRYIGGLLAEDRLPAERSRLLREFVPMMTAPLRALGGPGAIARVVDAIEAFDRRFVDAAGLVGSARPAAAGAARV